MIAGIALAVAVHLCVLGWFLPRVGLLLFALAMFAIFGYGTIQCLRCGNFAAAIVLALYAVLLTWPPLDLARISHTPRREVAP